LAEWRLDRYYASKLRLIDASAQAVQMASTPATESDSAQKQN